MRAGAIFSLGLSLALTGCRSSPTDRTYSLQGQVLSIASDHQQAVIKHEEIKGLMPGMTMPYKVKEERLLDNIAPGDLIEATLVVASNEAYLTTVKKTGQAALETSPAEAPAAPSASSGFEILKPGGAIPDGKFVDQNGRARTFASFEGSTVVITFIYTQCPLPDFCPLMDRHFVSIQQVIKEDPALKTVHLVSVSFDPLTDTPPVLKRHARELKADESRWTLLTGERDDIDQFAARFGLVVSRAQNDQRNITHNLRTAIVDAEGKLVKMYIGNEWTPAEVVSDLKTVVR